MKFKIITQILLFLFPWNLRRYLLNRLFNYKIHKTAKIGFSIILAEELIMHKNSRIHNLSICKNIDCLIMHEESGIASLNFITGFNTKQSTVFPHVVNRKCELILLEHSGITSRHYLDCNGGIYIGKYTTVAGNRSTLQTHSIDIYKNRQDVKPIIIGDYCFLGTGCIILGGSVLPNYAILAAGSVLSASYNDSYYLYGGVPAKPIKNLINLKVNYFERTMGFVN